MITMLIIKICLKSWYDFYSKHSVSLAKSRAQRVGAYTSSLFHYIGCVRLASLCRPRSAHSGEPLTRANRTITLALSW